MSEAIRSLRTTEGLTARQAAERLLPDDEIADLGGLALDNEFLGYVETETDRFRLYWHKGVWQLLEPV